MKFQNILHVDDDTDDCEMFLLALRKVSDKVGYTAIHEPLSAVIQLEKKAITPDVILLDFNMPLMNGIQFLQHIKKNIDLKDIPIIMFSTSSVEELKHRTKDMGAHDYITKPIDFNELVAICNKFLLD